MAFKGTIPWNKGKRGSIPWNKGLKAENDIRVKNNCDKLNQAMKKLYSSGLQPANKKIFSAKEKMGLKKYYEEQLLNTKDIGKIFHCSETVVIRILKEMNVNIGQSYRRILLFNSGKMVHPMSGKHHNLNTLKKLSETKKRDYIEGKIPTAFKIGQTKGEKSYNWQGGKSFEPYTKEFNKLFKEAIRTRDNFTCLKCNLFEFDAKKLYKKGLHCHHIDYIKENTFKENCCSLCLRCNVEVNTNRQHWTKFFQSLLSERYGYKYSDDGKVIIQLNKESNVLK